MREEAAELAAKLNDPLFTGRLPGGGLPPVWLQGRGADNHSLRALLADRLGVDVNLFRPFPEGGGEQPEGAGLGPAFGLAICGLKKTAGCLELSGERGGELEGGPRYRVTVALAVLLAFVVLATFGVRALQYRRHLSRIDEAIATMKEKKTAVEKLNRSVQRKRSRLAFITANLNEVRQADLLREMTALIPDDTYLTDYTFRGGRIEIGGLSPSASRLIPLLEASPLFRNVQFSSAIVSQGKENERFKIRLSLEEESG